MIGLHISAVPLHFTVHEKPRLAKVLWVMLPSRCRVETPLEILPISCSWWSV